MFDDQIVQSISRKFMSKKFYNYVLRSDVVDLLLRHRYCQERRYKLPYVTVVTNEAVEIVKRPAPSTPHGPTQAY